MDERSLVENQGEATQFASLQTNTTVMYLYTFIHKNTYKNLETHKSNTLCSHSMNSSTIYDVRLMTANSKNKFL
jgi:hypothetical protein